MVPASKLNPETNLRAQGTGRSKHGPSSKEILIDLADGFRRLPKKRQEKIANFQSNDNTSPRQQCP